MIPNADYIRKITGLRVRCVKSCSNTFDELDDYDAIIARSQKHGSGRGDHVFHSPLGGLYIVMRITSLGVDAHTLTPAAGLAVHDTVKLVLGTDTALKWVNDVMLGDKKVCGILCRSPRRGEYLIGVGINYATTAFALENAGLENAASLNAPEEKVTQFCAELLRRIRLNALSVFDCKRYNALCATVGKNVRFVKNNVEVRGFAEKVEADGTLLVKIGKATVAVDSGEVSLIRAETDG